MNNGYLLDILIFIAIGVICGGSGVYFLGAAQEKVDKERMDLSAAEKKRLKKGLRAAGVVVIVLGLVSEALYLISLLL